MEKLKTVQREKEMTTKPVLQTASLSLFLFLWNSPLSSPSPSFSRFPRLTFHLSPLAFFLLYSFLCPSILLPSSPFVFPFLLSFLHFPFSNISPYPMAFLPSSVSASPLPSHLVLPVTPYRCMCLGVILFATITSSLIYSFNKFLVLRHRNFRFCKRSYFTYQKRKLESFWQKERTNLSLSLALAHLLSFNMTVCLSPSIFLDLIWENWVKRGKCNVDDDGRMLSLRDRKKLWEKGVKFLDVIGIQK